jgi:hypothetical protein
MVLSSEVIEPILKIIPAFSIPAFSIPAFSISEF